MQFKYSPEQNCFYVVGIHKDIPDDAKDVKQQQYDAVVLNGSGKWVSDENGDPVVVEHDQRTEPSHEDVKASARERAKAELQPQRDLFLNRLSGIAVFATEQAVIEECADLRAQLLDITKTPAYLAAETFDEMKAALMARYRQIAAGASEAIRNVFRELDA